MKILVIGSGGREHAICRTFKKNTDVDLFCANGNAGIAQFAECVPIKPDDIHGLVTFAADKCIDFTFVGGETSLALGICDEFQKHGLKIIGPTMQAARLESSKSFAKDFMSRNGIPTAKYVVEHSTGAAIQRIQSGYFGDESVPVVVKADGLAAGKGVVVAADRREAIVAINGLADMVGSDAATKIVLEECLFGKEVSLLMFADGLDFALMPPVRDHKRIGEGDTGPNTGGMGTFSDDSLLSAEQMTDIAKRIIMPTLRGCINEGFTYRGILFLGLMVTSDGIKVIEYNVRFGDPETQSILVRLETDLVDICEAMLDGNLSSLDIKWLPGSSACIVLASEGYPSKPRTGDVITGLDQAAAMPNVGIFHAGTGLSESGEFLTAAGRVLGVTAAGEGLKQALSQAYAAVDKISWTGMQYRRDIGK